MFTSLDSESTLLVAERVHPSRPLGKAPLCGPVAGPGELPCAGEVRFTHRARCRPHVAGDLLKLHPFR